MSFFERFHSEQNYPITKGQIRVKTIDLHTGGEPLRVIVSGFPELQGNSVLEKRAFCAKHYDDLRKALMWEPRGHADMYGCILVPPNDPEGDFGIIFIHNEGYSTMCGHAIIGIATLALEMNWVKARNGHFSLKIDAPCGRIEAFGKEKDGKAYDVGFIGVPSFVLHKNQAISFGKFEQIKFDLAYGGAFYAYTDIVQFGIDLSGKNYPQLVSIGRAMKQAVISSGMYIDHPFEKDLSFLYGVIFIESSNEKWTSKNVCVFADGEVDRCPTGSGVMGRLAIHAAKDQLKEDEEIKVSSITGAQFKGKYLAKAEYGTHEAIIPQVEGSAFITGQHEFIIDPKDPFKTGFFLR